MNFLDKLWIGNLTCGRNYEGIGNSKVNGKGTIVEQVSFSYATNDLLLSTAFLRGEEPQVPITDPILFQAKSGM